MGDRSLRHLLVEMLCKLQPHTLGTQRSLTLAAHCPLWHLLRGAPAPQGENQVGCHWLKQESQILLSSAVCEPCAGHHRRYEKE